MITRLVIDELVPGLNGKDGLIREHWAKRKQRKDRYFIILRSQTTNRHKGCVSFTYIRHTVRYLDWDNHCASAKLVLDCLKDAKIIIDDKPDIIVEFIPKQVKAKRGQGYVEIIIEDYESN